MSTPTATAASTPTATATSDSHSYNNGDGHGYSDSYAEAPPLNWGVKKLDAARIALRHIYKNNNNVTVAKITANPKSVRFYNANKGNSSVTLPMWPQAQIAAIVGVWNRLADPQRRYLRIQHHALGNSKTSKGHCREEYRSEDRC